MGVKGLQFVYESESPADVPRGGDNDLGLGQRLGQGLARRHVSIEEQDLDAAPAPGDRDRVAA